MHELLLYGQVPAAKHTLVLSALAGLTVMQPQPLAERHLLFRPQRQSGTALDRATVKRAADAGVPSAFVNETLFVQAIGNLAVRPREAQIGMAATQATKVSDVKDGEGGDDTMAIDTDSKDTATGTGQVKSNVSDFDKYPWKIEFREFPAVPAKSESASKRAMLDIPLARNTSPEEFLSSLGYKYVSEHMLQGHRFTYRHIDIRLFRGYIVSSASEPASRQPMESIPFDLKSLLGSKEPPVKQPSPLQLLDQSGHYLLQARLFVADDSRPDVMYEGFSEMGKLKETLRGFIDLELGDRLAMNTRIR